MKKLVLLMLLITLSALPATADDSPRTDQLNVPAMVAEMKAHWKANRGSVEVSVTKIANKHIKKDSDINEVAEALRQEGFKVSTPKNIKAYNPKGKIIWTDCRYAETIFKRDLTNYLRFTSHKLKITLFGNNGKVELANAEVEMLHL